MGRSRNSLSRVDDKRQRWRSPPPLGLERGVCPLPERDLSRYAWSLKLHWPTAPSAIAVVLNCLNTCHPLLWPEDPTLPCPVHLPGLQLAILVPGCAPVRVNETADAKNSTELVSQTSQDRPSLLACLCGEISHISLELLTTVNHNFPYVWLIIHPVSAACI